MFVLEVALCEFEGHFYQLNDVIATIGCDGNLLDLYQPRCLSGGHWSLSPVRRLCGIGKMTSQRDDCTAYIR